MKENLKWLILGVSIVAAVFVYVFGTRYQAISVGSGGFNSIVIYNRMTGDRK